jgi:hypothetical protein
MKGDPRDPLVGALIRHEHERQRCVGRAIAAARESGQKLDDRTIAREALILAEAYPSRFTWLAFLAETQRQLKRENATS